MKKKLFSVLVVVASLLLANTSHAQVSVNINIGSQPQWGPTGYDYAEYYYMPDIESYYYVPRQQFVYMSGGRWVFSSNLPPRYANYDLYNGYKVVLKERDAYRHFNDHRARYARYRNYDNRQETIGSHDNGNHYGQYKNKDKGQGRGNDRDRGNNRGNGKNKHH